MTPFPEKDIKSRIPRPTFLAKPTGFPITPAEPSTYSLGSNQTPKGLNVVGF